MALLFQDRNHGLAFLEHAIFELAERDLRSRFPESVELMRAAHDPEQAAAIAVQANVVSPAVEIFNEAQSLEFALERLTNALSLAGLSPTLRSPAVSMAAEDTLAVVFSSVIDGLIRLVAAVYREYLGEDAETAPLRHGLKAWTSELKSKLKTMRDPVVHAQTYHMSDLAGLRYWESLIALGVEPHEVMASNARDQLRRSHEALGYRVEWIRPMAQQLIAKTFAECKALAELLERRHFPEPKESA